MTDLAWFLLALTGAVLLIAAVVALGHFLEREPEDDVMDAVQKSDTPTYDEWRDAA